MAVLLQGKPFYRFRTSFNKQVTDVTTFLSQAGTKVTAFAKREWTDFKRKRSLTNIYTVDQFLLVMAKAGVVEQAGSEDLAAVLATVEQHRDKFGNALAVWDSNPGEPAVLNDLEKEITEPRNISQNIFAKLDAKYSLKSFIHWRRGQITLQNHQQAFLALFKNGATLFKVIVTHPQLYASYSRLLPTVNSSQDHALNAGLQYIQTKTTIDSHVQAEKGWFTWRTATATRYFIDKFLAQQDILDQNHCALLAQTDAFWQYAVTQPGILFGRRERTLEETEHLKTQSPFFKARIEGISLVQLALNDENISYFSKFLRAGGNKDILIYELLSQASDEEMESLFKKYTDLKHVSLNNLPDTIHQRWLKAKENVQFNRENLQRLSETQKAYINEQSKSIKELSTALVQERLRVDSLQIKNAGLAAENSVLKQRLAEKDEQLTALQQAQNALFDDIGGEKSEETIVADPQAVQAVNKNLQQQLKEIQEKLRSTEAHAAGLAQQLQSAERKKRKELLAAQSNAELFKTKKNELEQQLKANEEQYNKLQVRYDEQTKELQRLQARVQELETLNTKLQTQKPAQVAGKTTVTITRPSVAPAPSNSDARSQTQLQKAQTDLEQTQGEKRRLEQQLAETKIALEQAKTAQQELSNTKASIASLQTSLHTLQETSETQKAQFQKLNAELEQNKKEATELKQKLEQTTRENKTLTEINAQLSRETSISAASLNAPPAAKPAATNSDTKTEISAGELQLKLKLRTNETEIATLKQQQIAKEKEVASLQEQLTEKAKEAAQLDTKLSQLQKDFDQVNREKTSLVVKVAELLKKNENPSGANNSSGDIANNALRFSVERFINSRSSLPGALTPPPAATNEDEDPEWKEDKSLPTSPHTSATAARPAATTPMPSTIATAAAAKPISEEKAAELNKQRESNARIMAASMQKRRQSTNYDASLRGEQDVITQTLAEQKAAENNAAVATSTGTVSARPAPAVLKPGQVPAPPPPPPRTDNTKPAATAARASPAAAPGSETPKGGSRLARTFSNLFNKGDSSSKDKKDKSTSSPSLKMG